MRFIKLKIYDGGNFVDCKMLQDVHLGEEFYEEGEVYNLPVKLAYAFYQRGFCYYVCKPGIDLNENIKISERRCK
tara:strand:+ start:8457 stop:8681 length:225 start_codon:yes stop_codon:yes gene_type:complete